MLRRNSVLEPAVRRIGTCVFISSAGCELPTSDGNTGRLVNGRAVESYSRIAQYSI